MSEDKLTPEIRKLIKDHFAFHGDECVIKRKLTTEQGYMGVLVRIPGDMVSVIVVISHDSHGEPYVEEVTSCPYGDEEDTVEAFIHDEECDYGDYEETFWGSYYANDGEVDWQTGERI